MKTTQHAAQHAPQTAQTPAPAPAPMTLDEMLDGAIIAERSALASVARARGKVAAAEEVLRAERMILDRAHALARSAAETVRVLRSRAAAHAQALAALGG